MLELTVSALIVIYWDCEVEYLQGRRGAEDMHQCIAVAEEINSGNSREIGTVT